MRSLQGRLGLQLLLTLLVAFLVLWLVVSSAIRGMVEDYIASRLGHDAESILTAVTVDGEGRLQLDDTRIDSIYQRPFSGHYFQIINGDELLTSRSLWDQQLALASDSVPGEKLHLLGPQQQPLLMVVADYQKQGRSLRLLVAEDLTGIEADIRSFQTYFSITAGIMLVLLIAASGVMLRRSLRSLQRVRDEVQALEQGERHSLGMSVPSEIAPLVGEVNRLLAVLNNRLQRSRHALGNLAHALKKPLTVLQQLQRDPLIMANHETAQTLASQVESMQRIIDHELRRARLAGEGHAGVNFNIQKDLPPLLEALEKIYRHKNLRIVSDIPAPLVLRFDREDMLELLGNLLDNAGKWARQTVSLSLRKNGGLRICIEDDGSGVEAAALDELAQRGKRLDESVAGHGLGLAIVRDILDQYHGHIRYGRSEQLGGLRVLITLPLATD